MPFGTNVGGLAEEEGHLSFLELREGKPPLRKIKEGEEMEEKEEESLGSLDMFGTVGRAVVLLMSYECGEAAELDVAQPTEAGVTVLDGGDHGGFRARHGGRLGCWSRMGGRG